MFDLTHLRQEANQIQGVTSRETLDMDLSLAQLELLERNALALEHIAVALEKLAGVGVSPTGEFPPTGVPYV